ncbi:NAD(P)-binding protein [Ceratobasidium sp. AG-I]|nr:NAD(P)-binding protein [Ceratobasidium sp. AG-I]
MSAPENIFILGATGYIGGAVFTGLRKTYPNVPTAALVRNPKDNAALTAAGARVVQGSHSDHEIIQKEASEADLVVNCADADDLELTKALLRGIKQRKEKTGQISIFVHTSGTSVVGDPPSGEPSEFSKKVWNDAKPEDIRSLDIKQPHRTIDVEIFNAHDRRDVDAYIVCPSCIYGIGNGPVRRISVQIPNIIRAALRRKEVPYVGKGTNTWNNVHIKDLQALYLLVIKHALEARANKVQVESYENFYFGSVGSHEWGDVSKVLAPLLYEKKLVTKPEAVSVPVGEERALDFNTGNNSCSTADRGRALGWKPSEAPWDASLKKDLDVILAEL